MQISEYVCMEECGPQSGPKKTLCQLLIALQMFLGCLPHSSLFHPPWLTRQPPIALG